MLMKLIFSGRVCYAQPGYGRWQGTVAQECSNRLEMDATRRRADVKYDQTSEASVADPENTGWTCLFRKVSWRRPRWTDLNRVNGNVTLL